MFYALESTIEELEAYIPTNLQFQNIGQKILECWKLSTDQKTYKEVPSEITRHWTKN